MTQLCTVNICFGQKKKKRTIFLFFDPYRSVSSDFIKYFEVHVRKTYEGQNASCKRGMPDLREGVPEDEGWMSSVIFNNNLISYI